MSKTNTSKKPAKAPAEQTKIASVIALLKRPKGATLEELGTGCCQTDLSD